MAALLLWAATAVGCSTVVSMRPATACEAECEAWVDECPPMRWRVDCQGVCDDAAAASVVAEAIARHCYECLRDNPDVCLATGVVLVPGTICYRECSSVGVM